MSGCESAAPDRPQTDPLIDSDATLPVQLPAGLAGTMQSLPAGSKPGLDPAGTQVLKRAAPLRADGMPATVPLTCLCSGCWRACTHPINRALCSRHGEP